MSGWQKGFFLFFFIGLLMFSCNSGGASLLPKLEDLMEGVPADFPRFYFSGHDPEAQLISRYLWYHFSTRPGNGKTVFNKEYLTTTDMWLSGAVDKIRQIPVQEAHREDLLNIVVDDEGYVHTHQHFSHAYDYGWPFPLWTQAWNSPEGVAGRTVGWHFQETGPDWMWVWGYLKGWKQTKYYGETATKGWILENVKSLGIVDGKWQLEATGVSPAIITPEGFEIEAFQSPFLQLRWLRTGEPPNHVLPYVEWLREGDSTFGPDRRVYFTLGSDEWKHVDGVRHSIIEMYKHPKWTGKIKRIRISLAPGESNVKFSIDSFFTCYDTRHTINNPIFILASWQYFRWTGDVDFLKKNINRMRMALRYQQTIMGGLKYSHIRNEWPGHDGLSGFVINPDGSKTIRPGHGIGSNYWDILPFGWDDMYATAQYYAATLVMADIEEAIRQHPEWGVPVSAIALDPTELRKHAADVKKTANRKFWDRKKGRFIGCIDREGVKHDYGFTFLNLDAIWYDIASEEHAKQIMDWISGKRIIDGDTSTGADIYRWRFGPRATTKRNVEWYCQGWNAPETVPWGGQVQDGGAVLGFAFYDLWARLKVYGPDDAWNRLVEILKWEKEVLEAGGYREYYKDGKQGTTLQGCGTAGGIGIDCEFYESILIPSIVTYGFVGLNPTLDGLRISPRLPSQCPEMGVSNVRYHGVKLDVKASNQAVAIEVKDVPVDPIRVLLEGRWRLLGNPTEGDVFELTSPGVYKFVKAF
jgi:hypothetical protein